MSVLEIRMRNWLVVFEDRIVLWVIDYCSIENVQEIWPTKVDFGWPNAVIGRKMANG